MKISQKPKQIREWNSVFVNISLRKSYAKCYGRASPRTFYKISKLSISLDHLSEMLYSLLSLYIQLEVCQNKLPTTCFYLILSSFKKQKGLGLVSLHHFLHDLWKKNSYIISYKLSKFHFLILFTSWDMGQYVYCGYLLPSLWHLLFFYITKKPWQDANILGTKWAFKMK